MLLSGQSIYREGLELIYQRIPAPHPKYELPLCLAMAVIFWITGLASLIGLAIKGYQSKQIGSRSMWLFKLQEYDNTGRLIAPNTSIMYLWRCVFSACTLGTYFFLHRTLFERHPNLTWLELLLNFVVWLSNYIGLWFTTFGSFIGVLIAPSEDLFEPEKEIKPSRWRFFTNAIFLNTVLIAVPAVCTICIFIVAVLMSLQAKTATPHIQALYKDLVTFSTQYPDSSYLPTTAILSIQTSKDTFLDDMNTFNEKWILAWSTWSFFSLAYVLITAITMIALHQTFGARLAKLAREQEELKTPVASPITDNVHPSHFARWLSTPNTPPRTSISSAKSLPLHLSPTPNIVCGADKNLIQMRKTYRNLMIHFGMSICASMPFLVCALIQAVLGPSRIITDPDLYAACSFAPGIAVALTSLVGVCITLKRILTFSTHYPFLKNVSRRASSISTAKTLVTGESSEKSRVVVAPWAAEPGSYIEELNEDDIRSRRPSIWAV